ncbi:acyl-CoA synthetase (AMP-forming)/AMP-acid ligase II [Frankia casuarinae]|uniref:AMP-dependent synthetase and ligase n=1 Tax=Frankia casuarinae (strain DSM 45818 / CECT 9043 / HFP020203 / CcI3) TaxID=106370 RepID=Q2JBN8_FRACC|nr:MULTISPECIES: AMP-binding protein [Frankia]ABD11304.1 AMP-dependent synthetase and ligase [Frankia casuarinae]ETA00626.1 acyl-CoA synthetase (AMP-forming)/AMP-acid ligase II [Frankia sp. CcI6]EYT90768.1 acyl-CoA synthetase (AMP-forming)/AMP-acid ligase II [Frankia casuarinae]KDA41582.1 acyl-CoA synthetase (AMP-forming)/AMP-acid ligase II [Frankia sp. BMG5.23]OAA20627.1 acyl-CoA synthetase (AMP-forming)/AMP-acid ligase II [Frankia casuarinae]
MPAIRSEVTSPTSAISPMSPTLHPRPGPPRSATTGGPTHATHGSHPTDPTGTTDARGHHEPLDAETLHDALDVAAARHPDTPVTFPSTHEVISLRDLAATSRIIAAALTTDGVQAGERVGVLAANSAEFLLALFAISRAGAAACPLPLPTTAHDLNGYADRVSRTTAAAGIHRVVTGGRVSAILRRTADRLGGLRFLPAADLVRDVGPATPTRQPHPGPECPVGAVGAVGADDVAIVQFTSGSTAAPKGVVLSHRAVLCGIRAIIDGIRLGEGDHGGIWLPLFHDMGLFATLSAIMTGIPMTVWSPADFVRDPAGWLRSFLASGATISPAPNFAYDDLVRAIDPDEVPGLDMRRWRVALNGAEPVSAVGVERFLDHFAPAGFAPTAMFPVYGMAEATLAVAFPPLGRAPVVTWVDRDRLAAEGIVTEVPREHPRAKGLVAVGRPVRDIRIRIADLHGDVLADPLGDGLAPSLRVGEIQIRGGSVTSGYLTAGGLTTGGFTADGWLRTGDLGFQRGDDLFVTGRDKEMIIIRGVNYYPEDAEAAVRDLPGVHRRRVVAFGSPDQPDAAGSPPDATGAKAAGGVTVVGETALTEPADRARLATDLRMAATAALGLSTVTVRLVEPGALPRTSSGKFQRLAVRDLVGRGVL